MLSFYRVRRLGSGSDFTKFYATLGMAAVDLRYTFDEVSKGPSVKYNQFIRVSMEKMNQIGKFCC